MRLLHFISYILLVLLTLSSADFSQEEKSFNELVNGCEDPSKAEVSVIPLSSTLRYVQRRTLNGRQPVVSIPIEIKNDRSESISSLLNHEWPGGIWPGSDLIVRARSTRKNADWMDVPGYLTGERGSENNVTFTPRQQRRFSIRLNWPGTGSIPLIFPLIPKTGNYFVQFLFRFTDETSKSKCVTSKMVRISVSK